LILIRSMIEKSAIRQAGSRASNTGPYGLGEHAVHLSDGCDVQPNLRSAPPVAAEAQESRPVTACPLDRRQDEAS
jgi:hypothetical protein